jgi:hypothetical protein
MVSGFLLAVGAYSFEATKGGAIERVLPFVVALIIILVPAPRLGRSAAGSR